ncbi:Hypothetical protein CINCED_3A023731 [Cinara cedri]|uniref:ODR-4-like n=1 Tax=Cinara cedri TaxID=506608 RepID=A0A5E4N4M8_9HEMI|nr:Hypothetical protein CINCED_3A023731 [Cinara cedri]
MSGKMPNKVFIEEHLKHCLENLSTKESYIPGVIVGQVIGENYYVVHLSAINIQNEHTNKSHALVYNCPSDLMIDSNRIFQKSLEVVNLLPGGSHVLGLFFIVPQDLKSVQPININFHEFNNLLVESPLCDKNKSWNYLQLNYSTVNKKSFCYTVDFNSVTTPITTTYKSISEIFGSFDNDWVTLVGKFNFDALDRFNVSGGPKALISIRQILLNKLESILNGSVCTFNGNVYDENQTLKDFECNRMGDLLTNVINVEFYRKLDPGNECKKASLKVERGKGKILMSGLCSLAVPFNRNGTIKSAIKAIHEDAMRTFTIRLNMHLQLLAEEEDIEEEGSSIDVYNMYNIITQVIIILL